MILACIAWFHRDGSRLFTLTGSYVSLPLAFSFLFSGNDQITMMMKRLNGVGRNDREGFACFNIPGVDVMYTYSNGVSCEGREDVLKWNMVVACA
jgi:hypothetical protein